MIASNATGSANIADFGSTGGTWVAGPGTNINGFYKICNGTEPTQYTITYNGISGGSEVSVTVIEILGANASNPDDIQSTQSTATPASATSSAASDIAVLTVGDVSATASTDFTAAPSGYTLQGRIVLGTTMTAIATQTSVGSGTISPGAWTTASAVVCGLGTILVKQ